MSTIHSAYHFAATSIQGFLLAGGKLKDLIGASDMVEVLAGDLLDAVLVLLENPQLSFSRRGGGAFTVIGSRDVLLNLQELWTLTVNQFAPGLGFKQGLADGATPVQAICNAIKCAEQNIGGLHPFLPLAGPLVERDPRTGQPAASLLHDEYLDATTLAKRHQDFSKGSRLTKRLLPKDGEGLRWPVLLSPEEGEDDVFPFLPDNQVLAVIHADGNGMGKMLEGWSKAVENDTENYSERMTEFSQAVTMATQAAAQEATRILVDKKSDKNILPGRPVVLGGDDLTMIVRADLALPFTRIFLEAFERESRKTLAKLIEHHPGMAHLPKMMTACAGIVFIKSRQPFYLALELADSLCAFAKAEARKMVQEPSPVPSTLAFHRITSSVIGNYTDILRQELTIPGAKSLQLTCQPYAVGEASAFIPRLDDLEALVQFLNLKEIRSSHARQLLTLFSLNQTEARKHYHRWRENLTNLILSRLSPLGTGENFKVLDEFDKLMSRFSDKPPERELPVVNNGAFFSTPLGDVMALLAVGGVSDG